MTNDTDAIIDDILARWGWWLRPLNVGAGHAHQAAGCGGYRSSRQYDDANGALDDAVEHALMKSVDAQIALIPDPYRTGLHAEARRLVVGVDVFRSARLPEGPKRAEVIAQARGMLMVRLTSAGIV